jgi:hypothetical protein
MLVLHVHISYFLRLELEPCMNVVSLFTKQGDSIWGRNNLKVFICILMDAVAEGRVDHIGPRPTLPSDFPLNI